MLALDSLTIVGEWEALIPPSSSDSANNFWAKSIFERETEIILWPPVLIIGVDYPPRLEEETDSSIILELADF